MTDDAPEMTPVSPADEKPTPGSEAAATDGDVSAASRPKIQVGSRRGDGSSEPAPEKKGDERPPRGNRGDRPRGPRPPRSSGPMMEDSRSMVPVPSKRGKLSDDLEAELAAALGDMSLDDFVKEQVGGRAAIAIEQQSRIRAPIVRVQGEHVFFSLGGKNEGYASIRQFLDTPVVGTHLDVVVRGYNEEDGLYDVVIPGGSVEVSDWSDLTEGAVVEARVSGSNSGGLEAMVRNIRAFIPASQVSSYRVANLADFVDQKLMCVVTEVNETRKNLVLSHRALLDREKEESRKKLLAELEVGQTREGVVRSVQDFGCFVDMGGVDGMIHISQLSWDRIKHPSEVVQEGQRIKVKVERINPENGKISLSYRDLLDRPWDNIEQKFPVGSTVKGTVTRIAKFGAFVKISTGIEGLIHISELSHGRVRRVEDSVKEGQEVEVKIVSVDADAQRIALSLKATLPPPETAKEAAIEEVDEAPRAIEVPSRNRPLRGGVNRPTGGDGIGLNW